MIRSFLSILSMVFFCAGNGNACDAHFVGDGVVVNGGVVLSPQALEKLPRDVLDTLGETSGATTLSQEDDDEGAEVPEATQPEALNK